MSTSPDPQTLPSFYTGYVNLVQHLDLFEALEQSGLLLNSLLQTIPEQKGEFRYAPGKWSIKELICHMMDAERVFGYRALRFARNDETHLSGFEENDYALQANANARSFHQLANEMQRLRSTTIDLFSSFTPEMLQRKGTANKNVISVINIGYVIAGHETHHRNILTERYLSA